MATPEQLVDLREAINESTSEVYTDERLSEIIDAGGSVARAAATIWTGKAGKAANLVDVAEGSSRRSLSDVWEHAIKMAQHWGSIADDESGGRSKRPGRTRPIVRP